MADVVKFRGTPFFMNGKEYIIPSLSLGQVRDNYKKITEMTAGPDIRSGDTEGQAIGIFGANIPVILMAVNRNYPEVTEADLWDWLDLRGFSEILEIVGNVSGFKTATPGEATPAI